MRRMCVGERGRKREEGKRDRGKRERERGGGRVQMSTEDQGNERASAVAFLSTRDESRKPPLLKKKMREKYDSFL